MGSPRRPRARADRGAQPGSSRVTRYGPSRCAVRPRLIEWRRGRPPTPPRCSSRLVLRQTPMNGPAPDRRVFISYAQDDADRAATVRHALAASGFAVADPGVGPGPDMRQELADAIRTSDVVVVLVSEAAARSRWAAWEQRIASAAELDARGVSVIPVRLDSATLPDDVSGQPFVDLSTDFESGLALLVEQVRATTLIDFGALSPERFERLVADLLTAAGFAVISEPQHDWPGIDLTARLERTDPLGTKESELWLVECKLYSRERVSIQSIRRLVGLLAGSPSGTRGLLVTSAQLTSVGQQYLAELEESARVRIRVLDGVRLVRLLRTHPAVVSAYFGAPPDGPVANA